MFIIRGNQIGAFQRSAEDQFVASIATYLRGKYPDEVVYLRSVETTVAGIDEPTLNAMVRQGVARARKYGMEQRGAVQSFITLMFLVAPNFDQHPAIARALINPDHPPDARVEELWAQTTDEDWSEAVDAYDETAWGLVPLGQSDR